MLLGETIMSETQPRRIGRTIGALLTGIFAGVILTVATDTDLHVTGVFPHGVSRPETHCSSLQRPI